MECSTSTASSCVKAISPGLAMGPPACSLRSLARPSQNCASIILEFRTVGELMGPCCHLCPIEVLRLSVPPILRLWQELHEMKPDLERRGSKKSILPSSTIPTFFGAAALIGWIGSLADAVAEAAIAQIDSNDTMSVRNIISILLKARLWWRSRLRLTKYKPFIRN
ncbi:MAG: hypothetical protein JW384_03757 [Nitrosomonadaceae bacterium]|nr:hypothetical protein [Nitrosomonadaceae bacterium]